MNRLVRLVDTNTNFSSTANFLIHITIMEFHRGNEFHQFEVYYYQSLLPKILSTRQMFWKWVQFQVYELFCLLHLFYLPMQWLFVKILVMFKSVAFWPAFYCGETERCAFIEPDAYSCVRPPALCRLWVSASCSFSSSGRRRHVELPPSFWLSRFQRAAPTRRVSPQPAAMTHLTHRYDTDRHTLLSKPQYRSRSSFCVIILSFGRPWFPSAFM